MDFDDLYEEDPDLIAIAEAREGFDVGDWYMERLMDDPDFDYYNDHVTFLSPEPPVEW